MFHTTVFPLPGYLKAKNSYIVVLMYSFPQDFKKGTIEMTVVASTWGVYIPCWSAWGPIPPLLLIQLAMNVPKEAAGDGSSVGILSPRVEDQVGVPDVWPGLAWLLWLFGK